MTYTALVSNSAAGCITHEATLATRGASTKRTPLKKEAPLEKTPLKQHRGAELETSAVYIQVETIKGPHLELVGKPRQEVLQPQVRSSQVAAGL